MDITYKSKNNIVYLCRYHVVWCSKYRRKILTNGIDTRLKELILSYAASISVDVVEMEIMPDYVRMLIEVEPQLGIHRAVKLLKGYTAKILRSEYPTLKTRVPSLWTNNYFVSTMSNIPQEIINQYIENQKTSQRQKDKPG
ncbi:MAG: IS200/IS605 family transposase [Lachnospira sp.]|jgi:putative transposase|nr:IS200/IS605 family transposase [Lachnospira sp.]